MQHFRLAKGWKQEVEEISLTLVLVLLFFTFSAATVSAVGPGLPFWGRTSVGTSCPTPEPLPCAVPGPAMWYVQLSGGNIPLMQFLVGSAASFNKYPRPGVWAI